MHKSQTIPVAIVVVLIALWLVPGLFYRDLWKADEPYSFGLVHHIVDTGDWVVPTLAGEPFLEKPPILFITAAGFVRVFSPPLTPHDAARLATAFFLLLTLLFIGFAAHELMGRESVAAVLLILIGTTGFQVEVHKLITDVALLSGLAAAIYGFALSRRRPALSGFWIGTGAGIGFMAKGLLAIGFIGLTALLLPALYSSWRKKSYGVTLLAAFAAALPWLLIWPIALYLRSPQFFAEWFWYQNFGRFFGFARGGNAISPTYYVSSLPWFALPSFPLALWALWKSRRAWQERISIQLPLVSFLVMLIILSLSSSTRDIYTLPMLLPLSLLAGLGASELPERARRLINIAALILFGSIAALLWAGWIITMTGVPSFLVEKFKNFQPDYEPAVNGFLLIAACLYTLMWIAVMKQSRRHVYSYLLNWTAGMVLVWGIAMTIWLPWLDAGSSYKRLFTSLRTAIPTQYHYILTKGLGESERALLEYYANIELHTLNAVDPSDCNVLLIERGGADPVPGIDRAWKPVWEYHRPMHDHGQPKEIFTLFTRHAGTKKAQCGEPAVRTILSAHRAPRDAQERKVVLE